jgi:hypothetical protein
MRLYFFNMFEVIKSQVDAAGEKLGQLRRFL